MEINKRAKRDTPPPPPVPTGTPFTPPLQAGRVYLTFDKREMTALETKQVGEQVYMVGNLRGYPASRKFLWHMGNGGYAGSMGVLMYPDGHLDTGSRITHVKEDIFTNVDEAWEHYIGIGHRIHYRAPGAVTWTQYPMGYPKSVFSSHFQQFQMKKGVM